MPAAGSYCVCPICDSRNREFVCSACVNSQDVLVQGQKQQLQQCLAQAEQLREQKADLLTRLEQQLAERESAQLQQVAAWRKVQELKAAHAKALKAKAALAQAQQQLHSLKAASTQRRQVLEQLVHRTGATRTAVLGTELPNVLRIQALTLSHVKAMLEREQRMRLRQLTEIFPLRINAVRSSGGPIQITICNLKLPESASTPAGGWPEPEATSAALGYLLLFIDQVGLIMGGPVLHESMNQGSTSSIWQPPGFWTRQPRSPGSVLPLNVLAAGLGAGTTASQAAYTSSSSRYLQSNNFWGLSTADSGSLGAGTAAAAAAAASAATAAAAAFSRAAGFEAQFYGSSPSGATLATAGSLPTGSNPLEPGGRSSKGSDFKPAWDLLQRSLACFLKDKAAKNGMQLPAAWNPLAWLVVYCAVVKRDMRQDGKLVALSTQANAAAAAAAGAGSSRMLGPGGGGDAAGALVSESSLGSMVVGAAGGAPVPAGTAADIAGWDEEEEDEDGWVVQTPFLPPPPSQPDEVEHYVKAMFADPNALAGIGQPASQGLGLGLGLPGRRGSLSLGAAAGGLVRAGLAGAASNVHLGSSPSNTGGMMPMERIRSLFSM